MRRFVRNLLLAATLVASSGIGLGDTFVLNDGRRIEGRVARETPTSYFVETGVGEVEVKKSELKERLAGKTAREEFVEREAAAKSAEDFFQLANWAGERQLRIQALKCFKRAVELEPQHAGANQALGNVLYKGRWMTPEKRDEQARADEAAEMAAKGLVRWKDRWVTPEEQQKLEQGLILRDGKWITEADSKRLDGLEEFGGRWYPKLEALARADAAAVEKLAGHPLNVAICSEAALAGDWDVKVLEDTGRSVVAAREWFNTAYQVEPGLKLLGGRLAEFYLWNRDSRPYVATVEHFASLTRTVPQGWAEVVKERHGFFWIDPYALSSARVWNRPDADLVGHCIHHWGHMLVGRLGYDGRLLPPWYDEGLASLTEFKLFKRNSVFCRSASTLVATGGTSAKRGAMTFTFDAGLFREGAWKDTLKRALEAQAVPSFDRLAELEIGQLELLDIACGMALVAWMEDAHPTALAKFHASLRKAQPRSPERVLHDGPARQKQYDTAFQAALGLPWREADKAWRAWFVAQ